MILEQGRTEVLSCPMPGDKEQFGLFETFKGTRIGNEYIVMALDYHLSRLHGSAEDLKIGAPTKEEIREGIAKAVSFQKSENLILRIVLTRHSWWIISEPWLPRLNFQGEGVSLISIFAQRENPEHKFLSAEISKNTYKEAKEKGYEEALIVDKNGLVKEGSWSNFFWVDKKGAIHTPEFGVLPGVTRRVLLENEELSISFKDLTCNEIETEAQEVFITNAMHGIVPVNKIGNLNLEIGISSKIAKRALSSLSALHDNIR